MSTKDSIKDVLASTIGSAACVYTGQPFDTVKVRMQVQPDEFTGAIQCFRKTFQGEGVSAMWKGSLPALSGALSENMMAFGLNGHIQRLFTSSDKKWVSPELENVLSGSLTGLATAFVLCPLDVLKCRAQMNQAQGGSGKISTIAKQLIKEAGVKGLYRGIVIQALRDIPFYAFFFGCYDVSCKMFKKHTSVSDATSFFVSGGLAGQAAWVASMPMDTIKSVIQTTPKPEGIMATCRHILAKRGVGGLFLGIDVALIRAFPANAALFCAYEMSRAQMNW